MNKVIIIFLISSIFNTIKAEPIYFPPIIGNQWESISPESLNWNINKIDSLYNFLGKTNTKAFIVLKDGRIVLEKYFDSFELDSNWYWASAGKTLTATLVGIAQADGLLNVNDKTSDYLGKGWTSLEESKEDLITLRHHLTMTTGLDYQIDDLDCTDPVCLKYKSDAGSQWYYHNAPYTLLENVVEEASGKSYNQFFFEKIRNKIGMNGAWFKLGFNNVYFSTARSMARFGLLIANNGNWKETEIITDKQYLSNMINTSQELNKSYGYLWWLNGKESMMIPGTEIVFNTMLMPDAPHDLYSALGKDGQILNISPSKGIIVVRMGERPDNQFFISTNYANDIWKHLNEIMDSETSVWESHIGMTISPNPASEYIEINLERWAPLSRWSPSGEEVRIYNTFGELVISDVQHLGDVGHLKRIDISHLPVGLYFIQIGNYSQKFIKY